MVQISDNIRKVLQTEFRKLCHDWTHRTKLIPVLDVFLNSNNTIDLEGSWNNHEGDQDAFYDALLSILNSVVLDLLKRFDLRVLIPPKGIDNLVQIEDNWECQIALPSFSLTLPLNSLDSPSG